MRGRDRFARWRAVIDLVESFLGLVPTSVARLGLECCRDFPGLLGFGIRYALLRRLAKRCGAVVSLYPGAHIINVADLEIGDSVSIHQMCYLECAGGLRIGSNVSIAHATSIVTLEHDYLQTNVPIRDAAVILKPVTVEDNVWIGAGVRILAGVVIGEGSVVGAGAVVTRSVPKHSVVAGVPARVIRTRPSGG